MDEGEGGHGETKDPADQLHLSEAIPAVADDAFLPEEDEDYDDLDNDINVDQVFHQTFLKKKDSRVKSDEDDQKKMPPPPPRPSRLLSVQLAEGSTGFFVGKLHWGTTDADLESELSKYGQVRDVRFFADKVTGKSKGYCMVEFYDPVDAAACKKGMDGHAFNGKPCQVSSSLTPFIDKFAEEEEARDNMNQPDVAMPGDGNGGTGGINQGGDGSNRGYGRGNQGRGNDPRMGNRGVVNRRRGRGRNAFGQGIGVAPRMMTGHMGRMGGYAGFPSGPRPPFYGISPSYPTSGWRGLAPHVNHSFYGRGMPMHGMRMIPPNTGMWPYRDMGGWDGDEHGGGRGAESSYREEAASDHQYNEVNHDRADLPNAMREKDRGSERDRPGPSERTFKDDKVHEFDRYMPSEEDLEYDHEERRNYDDREIGRGQSRDSERARSQDHDRERGHVRDRHREDRDKYADHNRYKDHEAQHDDERERGQSSRSSIKSRLSTHEREHQSRKDSDSRKRRQFPSE